MTTTIFWCQIDTHHAYRLALWYICLSDTARRRLERERSYEESETTNYRHGTNLLTSLCARPSGVQIIHGFIHENPQFLGKQRLDVQVTAIQEEETTAGFVRQAFPML